jgi:nucleotide-binding universal stress UspA family protein
MFKKIVWATDGSEFAELALPYAKSLAAEEGGALVIVHCEEFMVAPRGGGMPFYADEEDVKANVERQKGELANEGFEVSSKIVGSRAGGAAHAIADVASEVGADLIVVGTRGRTALGGLLLGSVTQRLLHIAECPVFAVPAGKRAETEGVRQTATHAGA